MDTRHGVYRRRSRLRECQARHPYLGDGLRSRWAALWRRYLVAGSGAGRQGTRAQRCKSRENGTLVSTVKITNPGMVQVRSYEDVETDQIMYQFSITFQTIVAVELNAVECDGNKA